MCSRAEPKCATRLLKTSNLGQRAFKAFYILRLEGNRPSSIERLESPSCLVAIPHLLAKDQDDHKWPFVTRSCYPSPLFGTFHAAHTCSDLHSCTSPSGLWPAACGPSGSCPDLEAVQCGPGATCSWLSTSNHGASTTVEEECNCSDASHNGANFLLDRYLQVFGHGL